MWDSKTSRNAGNTVQSRNVGYRQKGCGIQKVNVQHEYEIQRIREHDTEDRNLGHTVRIPWNTVEKVQRTGMWGTVCGTQGYCRIQWKKEHDTEDRNE